MMAEGVARTKIQRARESAKTQSELHCDFIAVLINNATDLWRSLNNKEAGINIVLYLRIDPLLFFIITLNLLLLHLEKGNLKIDGIR